MARSTRSRSSVGLESLAVGKPDELVDTPVTFNVVTGGDVERTGRGHRSKQPTRHLATFVKEIPVSALTARLPTKDKKKVQKSKPGAVNPRVGKGKSRTISLAEKAMNKGLPGGKPGSPKDPVNHSGGPVPDGYATALESSEDEDRDIGLTQLIVDDKPQRIETAGLKITGLDNVDDDIVGIEIPKVPSVNRHGIGSPRTRSLRQGTSKLSILKQSTVAKEGDLLPPRSDSLRRVGEVYREAVRTNGDVGASQGPVPPRQYHDSVVSGAESRSGSRGESQHQDHNSHFDGSSRQSRSRRGDQIPDFYGDDGGDDDGSSSSDGDFSRPERSINGRSDEIVALLYRTQA